MIYGPSKRLTQNPNPRQYPSIPPTVRPLADEINECQVVTIKADGWERRSVECKK